MQFFKPETLKIISTQDFGRYMGIRLIILFRAEFYDELILDKTLVSCYRVICSDRDMFVEGKLKTLETSNECYSSPRNLFLTTTSSIILPRQTQ